MDYVALTSWHHFVVGPVVDEQQVEMLQNWLHQQLNAHTGTEKFKLTLIINANSGSYPACLAMYDCLRRLEDGVELYVVSQGVLSGPLVLLPLAADYKRRFMGVHTVFQLAFPKAPGHWGEFRLDIDGPLESEEYEQAQRKQAEWERLGHLPILYSLRDAAALILVDRLRIKERDYRWSCDMLRNTKLFDGEAAVDAGFACDVVPMFTLRPPLSQPEPTAEQNMRAGYL